MKTRLLSALAAALVLITTAPAELIARYTFDGVSGNTATDSAGTAQNAIITGGSFVTVDDRGRVLSMTGTGQNANFATLAVTSTTKNYTFATWYKGTDVGYLFDQQTTRFVTTVESGFSAPAGLAAYNTLMPSPVASISPIPKNSSS